ncbi:MAG: hypothetical protein MUP76_04905 [Acidimicrobiia bacterium]|nr:hypothetical protein [Acidimicrobiia bacterium]
MNRLVRALLALGVIMVMTGGPALAQSEGVAVIDVTDFVSRGEGFVDLNGDGIPDLGELSEGFAGIWDEQVGERTPEDFQALVVDQVPNFDVDDEGSNLVGACGGLAISYDEEGMSVDAMIDLGDANPAVDAYTGDQAMTSGNPFVIDPGGVIVYWGFTNDLPTFSLQGEIPSVDYGDPNPAFHDHSWTVSIMGVSADRGGDPNQRDKNRNAGLVELGEILSDIPVPSAVYDLTELNTTVKAKGAIIDLYAAGDISGKDLPDDFDLEVIQAEAAGAEFCFGEGWVKFNGSGPGIAPTAIAALLAAAGFAGVLFNVRPAQSWRA